MPSTEQLNAAQNAHNFSNVPVQTITQLKAIAFIDRTDKKIVFVEDVLGFYEWDEQNSSPDNGDTIISPNDNIGRWRRSNPVETGFGNVISDAISPIDTLPRYSTADGKHIKESLVSADNSGSLNIPTGQLYKINGNQHTHDPSDVGNSLAEWNANKIQGIEVDDTDIGDGKLLKYNSVSGKLEYESDILSDETTLINNHISDTNNPHSVTKTQIGLSNVTDDAQLKRSAGDYVDFPNKANIITDDVFLIEDSENGGAKKYTLLDNILSPAIEYTNNHIDNQSNPHNVTKTQIGLGSVTNVDSGVEDGYIRIFIGKGAAGNETPDYSSTSIVTDGNSLEQAIGALDENIGSQPTPVVRTNNPISANDPVSTRIDKLDKGIGVNPTSLNNIESENTINANLSELDAKLGNNPVPVVRTNNPIVGTNDTHANIEKLDAAIGVTPTSINIISASTSVNVNLSSLDSSLNSHTSDATIHRSINDSTTTTTSLWSSDKINTELGNISTGIASKIAAPVQTLALLKAIDTTSATSYPDKVILHVEDSGIYRLDRDSSTAEDSPRIITPTTGSGRWFRLSTTLTDHNNLNSLQGGTASEYYHATLNQNDALVGTSGTPSSTNKYVTDADVRGISKGGTGQTTANPAFNDLSPLTTKGDLITFSTVNARLPIGSDNQILTPDSTDGTFGLIWSSNFKAIGQMALSNVISPPALTGNVNNYAPTGINTANVLRINGGAVDRNITGILAPSPVIGQIILLCNVGTTNTLILINQSGSSTPANRFILSNDQDIQIPVNATLIIFYDVTSARYRMLGTTQ